MLVSFLLLLLSAVTADSTSNLPTVNQLEPVTKPFLTIIPSTSSELSRCPLSLARCGSVGCFDRNTYKCCPSARNVCETAQSCVEVQLEDGNIAAGCCHSGMSSCGDTCFDISVSKCCARPRGLFGLCPVGAECCGDMCCGRGEVCGSATSRPKCWPESLPIDQWTTAKSTATASIANTTATIAPPRKDCCGFYFCPEGEVCAISSRGPKCFPKDMPDDWRSTKDVTLSSENEKATTTFSSASSSYQIPQSSISVPVTTSSGGARRVVPRLLHHLLPHAYADFTLSPVDIGRDIPEVKDQGEQQISTTGPQFSKSATSIGPTNTELADKVTMRVARGDLPGGPSGPGGSRGNSSASQMAIGGMEVFAGVKIDAVHVATLVVLVAAVYSLV